MYCMMSKAIIMISPRKKMVRYLMMSKAIKFSPRKRKQQEQRCEKKKQKKREWSFIFNVLYDE